MFIAEASPDVYLGNRKIPLKTTVDPSYTVNFNMEFLSFNYVFVSFCNDSR